MTASYIMYETVICFWEMRSIGRNDAKEVEKPRSALKNPSADEVSCNCLRISFANQKV